MREDLTDPTLYLIVYDPNTKRVRIIRVRHGMRDVEDILN